MVVVVPGIVALTGLCTCASLYTAGPFTSRLEVAYTGPVELVSRGVPTGWGDSSLGPNECD